MRRLRILAWSTLPVGVFLASSIPLFRLVGCTPMEARDHLAAYAMIHAGVPEGAIPAVPHLDWRGRHIPLMCIAFHGPTDIYADVPFVVAFGPTLRAVHARNAFFGAATVWLLFMAALALDGDVFGALAASLILASAPSFVGDSLFGSARGQIVMTAMLACIFLGARYARSRRPETLAAAAGCAGAGLTSKSWFALALALLAAYALLYRRRACAALPQGRGERLRLLAACAIAFLLPLGPALIYAASSGVPIAFLSRHAGTSLLGVRNLSYLANLPIRLGQLSTLWDGRAGTRFVVADPETFKSGLSLLMPTALLGALADAARRPDRLEPEVVLPWFLFAGYLAGSPFSPTGLYTDHLLPLLPLGAMTAGQWASRRAKSGGRGLRLAGAGVLLAVLLGFLSTQRLAARLRAHGPALPILDPKVAELARWTQGQGGRWTSGCDSLGVEIDYLTAGRLDLDTAPAEPAAAAKERYLKLNELFGTPRSPYFFVEPEFLLAALKRGDPALASDSPRRYLACSPADAASLRDIRPGLRLIKEFSRPDGSVLFSAYEDGPTRR